MNTLQEEELIANIESKIVDFDPTPVIENINFPLRWESDIFMVDYDFKNNILDLDKDIEDNGGRFLVTLRYAIEIKKSSNGTFHFTDGAFYTEAHTWCKKLNSGKDFPPFELLKKEFDDFEQLVDYLNNEYD
jgi:hypothetical protein